MESTYSPVTDPVQGVYCQHCGRQNADHCAACRSCDAVGILCSSCFQTESVQHQPATEHQPAAQTITMPSSFNPEREYAQHLAESALNDFDDLVEIDQQFTLTDPAILDSYDFPWDFRLTKDGTVVELTYEGESVCELRSKSMPDTESAAIIVSGLNRDSIESERISQVRLASDYML